jgi:thioester reductase-like protein
MTKRKTVFITGATGGLGRELVRTFLEETDDFLLLLVRPKRSVSHEERVKKLFHKMGINGNSAQRIEVLAGDVTEPRLGLSDEAWKRVVQESNEFYHAAALTNLGAAWEEAERINLQGTIHALETAKEAASQGRLERFFYFSTAFVAGSLTPIHALEDELPENPSFSNAYEATKFLAEKKVREALAGGLPATIFRPSIVVGDSVRGAVSEFNVIYPFFRLFLHGFLKRIPSRLENSFNIVPIDFVVKGSFFIARQKSSLGKTFHLVSEEPPTLQMILEVKKEKEYESFPPVEVLDPDRFSLADLDPSEKEVFPTLKPYLGYLGSSLTFDTRNTRQVLEGSGISFPKTDLAFLKKIIDYALEKGYFVRP